MIVISTPTGYIGRKVLRHLLQLDGVPLRVIGCEPEWLPDGALGQVEIVQGAIDDPANLRAAFAGAAVVFWCHQDLRSENECPVAHAELASKVASAISSAKVPRVVATSAAVVLPTGTDGLLSACQWMESGFESSGAACCFLQCGILMENFLQQWEKIIFEGYFSYPVDGELRRPHVCAEDVARVATDFLTRPDWLGIVGVPLLGPSDLSYLEIAETLTRIIERPVSYERIRRRDHGPSLEAHEIDPAVVPCDLETFAGSGNWNSRGVDIKRSLTPTTFEAWLRRDG